MILILTHRLGEYHAVNQIVAKSLHTADDDAFAYTKTLLERLETTKTEHAADDSIVDNDAAKAYVEVFAQQTFDRAERTLRANKVTRQTADTFDAAATFFDLLREWGELEPEINQKIKFAKWNAARILKAIREGRDPNESNPKMAEEEEENPALGVEGLDPNDPDVQQLTSPGVPQPASVQDVPDAGEPLGGMPPPVTHEVSPLQSSSHQPHVQEDYFPPGHVAVPPTEPSSIPSVPPEPPATSSSQIPPQPSPQIPTKVPSQFSPPAQPEAPSPPPWETVRAPPPPVVPVSPEYPPSVAAPPPQPTIPVYSAPPPAPVPAPAPAPMPSPAFTGNHKDINKAQKHAKFAISALNFDDVPTAIQELRNALASLGTQ